MTTSTDWTDAVHRTVPVLGIRFEIDAEVATGTPATYGDACSAPVGEATAGMFLAGVAYWRGDTAGTIRTQTANVLLIALKCRDRPLLEQIRDAVNAQPLFASLAASQPIVWDSELDDEPLVYAARHDAWGCWDGADEPA